MVLGYFVSAFRSDTTKLWFSSLILIFPFITVCRRFYFQPRFSLSCRTIVLSAMFNFVYLALRQSYTRHFHLRLSQVKAAEVIPLSEMGQWTLYGNVPSKELYFKQNYCARSSWTSRSWWPIRTSTCWTRMGSSAKKSSWRSLRELTCWSAHPSDGRS